MSESRRDSVEVGVLGSVQESEREGSEAMMRVRGGRAMGG